MSQPPPKRSSVPNEVHAAAANPEWYARVALEKDDIRRPYTLADRYCRQLYDGEVDDVVDCPLIVFVNSRSGGRAGADLTLAFQRHLGRLQVFDLSINKPGPVMRKLWANFDEAAAAGDEDADATRAKLRVLVAGGDGTIAWVLGTIKQLGLVPEPPVAMIPLGTGNDLSRSFGWGPAFDPAWIGSHSAMYNTLRRIALAEPRPLDVWRVDVVLPDAKLRGDMPYSLSETDGPTSASGLFWNYLSVGLDAKAAFGFHHLRETKPYLAAGRMMNQAAYAFFSCSSGWFCCTRSLRSKVKLQARVAGKDDSWQDVKIPRAVKALVVLNLQS